MPVIGANGKGGELKIVTVMNTDTCTHEHTHKEGERNYCKGPLGTQISYKYTDTWTQVSLSYEHRMCSL